MNKAVYITIVVHYESPLEPHIAIYSERSLWVHGTKRTLIETLNELVIPAESDKFKWREDIFQLIADNCLDAAIEECNRLAMNSNFGITYQVKHLDQ